MKVLLSFIKKETKHILRDKRTMLILFGMPVVLSLIFGFAISTDVRNVRTVIVLSSQDHETGQLAEALGQSEYFNITATVATPEEAERLIRDQQADVAVVFPQRFASRHEAIQLIVDGSDPNMAQQYANYASSILRMQGSPTAAITTTLLYNPQMKSTYNFVPGIMGILMILICAMMTSISIVKEKERGTMEVLLVSPVRPIVIIVSKAIPYMGLAFLVLTSILLLSRYVIGVPIHGSLLAIYSVSTIYILLALSLGLLISTIAKTQIVALLFSAVILLMPSILLSGMIYPVESMPETLQYVSALIPPRYYISAMRKLMVMGTDWSSVAHETTVLASMAAFFLLVALRKFNQRLDV